MTHYTKNSQDNKLTDALQELQKYPNWVGAILPKKTPKNPHTGNNAQSTNPKTWGTYEQATEAQKRYKWNVIGFACHPETIPLVFIDLDHCVENGVIADWAMAIIERIDSYTEISPSGGGVHVLVYGYLPDNIPALRPTADDIALVPHPPLIPEMYHEERWFTITGNHVPGTPLTIKDKPRSVLALHKDTKAACDGYRERVRIAKSKLNGHISGDQRRYDDNGDYESLKAEIKAAFDFDRLVNFAQSLYPGKTEPADHSGVRIKDHGGLVVYPDPTPHWKNYSQEIGGDVFSLAALYLFGSHKVDGPDFHKAMVLAGEFAGIDISNRLRKSRQDNQSESRPPKSSDLPRIQTNARHHREISEDAYNALLASNTPPRVFVRSGKLTRIKLDENGRPIAEEITPECLGYELDRAANFYKFRHNKTDDKITETDGSIQMAVVKDIMAYPQWVELPPLVSIVQYPTFSPDGTLHTEPGYNPAARTFYYRNGLKLGDLEFSGNTTWARDLILEDLLKDFPFVDDASKAHAVAAFLLPFVRPLIDGPTPLHIVDAPQFGTGKSKLCKAISIPAAPNGISLITPPDNDEEWRKTIVSALMQAPSHILIDNIPDKLESGTLSGVLTATDYEARLLGVMQMIRVANRAVWLGTGNNTSAHGELARRIIWIRLDAEMEKPWERKEFKHPHLERWALENRADLVRAALILVNTWVVAGCPKSEKPLGGFEDWAAIMGGILEANGFKDFLGNADEMYDRANSDREPWKAFVAQWYDNHGHNPVGVKQLFPVASYHDPQKDKTGAVVVASEGLNLLGEFVDKPTERARQTQLGALLRNNTDKVYGQHKIVKAKKRNNAAQYKLRPLKTLV